MLNEPWISFVIGNLPNLLKSDPISLWVLAHSQFEVSLDLLSEVPSTTLTKDGLLGPQLHASHVHVTSLTLLGDAHVASDDSIDGSILVIEHISACESWVDVHSQLLSFVRESLTEISL